MKEERNKINRRNFLKTIGSAGLTTAFASAVSTAGPNDPNVAGLASEKTQKLPQVPRRKLGKTSVDVPVLSLGAMFNVVENQISLIKALQYGVSYWDTAHGYVGGNSELGIGKFLSRNPDARGKLFIATKASGAKNAADVEKRLASSLKRMNTNYIDLYYGVHALTEPSQLTDELKQWAESAKKRKLIRFFGFSTHKNMPQCLNAAAKLDWIDVIMTGYNYRLMQDKELNTAIDSCHKAGIGLVAMKTQGRRQRVETNEDKKLIRHFLERGFTEGQAKIKLVLADRRFSSACVGRGDIGHLMLNIAAVLDKTRLTQADMEFFKEHARATCSGYCAGCAHICDSALPEAPYVSDIMRYLMYYNSYGEQDTARELFAQIPSRVRSRLPGIDYSCAEARCPQHLPIGELVAEAVNKLA